MTAAAETRTTATAGRRAGLLTFVACVSDEAAVHTQTGSCGHGSPFPLWACIRVKERLQLGASHDQEPSQFRSAVSGWVGGAMPCDGVTITAPFTEPW